MTPATLPEPRPAPSAFRRSPEPGNAAGSDLLLLVVLAGLALTNAVRASGEPLPAAGTLFLAGAAAVSGCTRTPAGSLWTAALLSWALWHTLTLPSAAVAVSGYSLSLQVLVLLILLLYGLGTVLRGRFSPATVLLHAGLSAGLLLCAVPGFLVAGGVSSQTAMAWVHGLGFLIVLEPLRRALDHRGPRRCLSGFSLAMGAFLILKGVTAQ